VAVEVAVIPAEIPAAQVVQVVAAQVVEATEVRQSLVHQTPVVVVVVVALTMLLPEPVVVVS
jgi:hypothetical protein